MTERVYQKRLAGFIRRAEAARKTRSEKKKWDNAFDEFLCIDCTPKQADRALDLYQLHVSNLRIAR